MVNYKCFNCGKEIDKVLIERTIRCHYCGSKILFKPQNRVLKVIKAR